ncbi:hypothetical protein Q9L58_001832 [Maublancomyces gigas]|uniref:DUF7918 domain-containing protein n=1 Tax=Discina gigas TaxID=1032678 RepID=A0ABR3GU82_9PEZI
MPVLNNISCTIHTDTGPIREFPCAKAHPPSAPTSTVYIPVRDGQTFTINCNVLVPSQQTSTSILVFGASIDGVQERGKALRAGGKHCIIAGTKVQNSRGVWELRKFLFSRVNFTEDHVADALAPDKINKLGEIVVTVRRCRVLERRPKTRGIGQEVCVEGPSVVHEKSVKGRDVSHSVSRAKGTPVQTPKSFPGTYLDTMESPYMVFRFLYKSERALKTMGLLEYSPSPPPPTVQIERSNGFTKPKAEIKEVKHEHRYLKRERTDSGPSATPGRKKTQKMAPQPEDIETVDLTGDD